MFLVVRAYNQNGSSKSDYKIYPNEPEVSVVKEIMVLRGSQNQGGRERVHM
jgi:hypothetical protein